MHVMVVGIQKDDAQIDHLDDIVRCILSKETTAGGGRGH